MNRKTVARIVTIFFAVLMIAMTASVAALTVANTSAQYGYGVVENPFADVIEGEWYYEGVMYAFSHGYMKGTNAEMTAFSPSMEFTREQFVQLLFNMEGLDASDYAGDTGFSDVPVGQWYSAAVKWAAKAGVTTGIGGGKFGLGGKVTREQLAKFLMNYAEIRGVSTAARADVASFSDAASVSGWATDAVAFAVAEGLIGSTSTSAKVLSPGRVAVRSEIAKITMSFDAYLALRYPIVNYHNADGAENPNPTTYSSSDGTELTDLSKNGYDFMGWYSDAKFTNKVTEIAAGTTGTIDLYAKWEAIKYTATFKDGNTVVGKIKFTVETDSITPPAVPEHKGYTGVWESYALGTEDIVIDAVYEVIPYSITFHNVEGATHANPTGYDVSIQPIELNDARKTGYTFMGWYTESTFENKATAISVGSTGNLDLYAKWEAIKYTATFKDGNTVVGKIKFTVETDSITPPAVPEHKGYTGVWESYTLGAKDITVNAVYTIMKFTITWRNSNGVILGTTICDYGKIPKFVSETPAKESDSKYDYTFAGWAPKIKAAYDNAGYIAVYNKTARTSYVITYDANGGTNAPLSQNKTSGSSTTLSTSVPTKEGKKFVGWLCANNGKTYKAGASFNIDADVTLYAVWGHN